MKHKFWIVFLTIATALCLSVGLAACGESGEAEELTPTAGLHYNEVYGEDGVTVIGYYVGAGTAAHEKEIVIPATHNNLPVLSVGADEEFLTDFFQSIDYQVDEETLEQLHLYTFMYCDEIESVTIEEGVTLIEFEAFTLCSSLKSIKIPDSVTFIGGAAFYYCTELTSITIPHGVTAIGREAFEACVNLTNVTFKGTTDEWRAIEKDVSWRIGAAFQSVVCSDGTLTGYDIG